MTNNDGITNDTVLTLKCDKCGKEYQIKGKIYRQRVRRNNPNFCYECMKAFAAERSKESKMNMSDERKAEYSRKLSEANKKYWNNMDEGLKEKRFEVLREQNEQFQKSLTPDRRKELGMKIKAGHSRMSEESRQRMFSKMSESMKKHHSNMTPEEKEIFSQQIKSGMSKMTDEERQDMKNAWTNWWNSLSKKDQSKHMYTVITLSAGNNKFHQKFVNGFTQSHLSNDFDIREEVLTTDNNTSHYWDYGVYSKDDGNLVAVVDLDGAYYHADSCDYDGLHSHEEYDEKRSLSVPDEVKICIINEHEFAKCFERMTKELMMNYNEYVASIFKECRSMPFPDPHYTNEELLHSYNNLRRLDCNNGYYRSISVNVRIGDRLIQHFHPSIYRAHRQGEISPYDAWYNDDLLMKVIENRIIYQNHLNPNKILQGFNVSKIATKVSVFSAARAKMIIHRYLSEYDTIFDPFSGFSGRMLGVISLNKRYIGQDTSDIVVNESNALMKFLKESGVVFDATITQANILDSSGIYQCLFTCPPYEDKEQWLDVPVSRRTCDDWIEICLKQFKCKRYLFVVDYTERYKEYIVDTIINKSHFGKNNEYIIMI